MHASERFRLASPKRRSISVPQAGLSPPASALRSPRVLPSPRRPSLRRPIGLSVPPRPAAETDACLHNSLCHAVALMTNIEIGIAPPHLMSWHCASKRRPHAGSRILPCRAISAKTRRIAGCRCCSQDSGRSAVGLEQFRFAIAVAIFASINRAGASSQSASVNCAPAAN